MEDSRKTKGLASISNVISPMAKKMLGKRGFVEVDIITNWNKIVGEELAEFSQPQKIDFKKDQRNGGTLHITVITGAFAVELQHREKFVIEKINTYFGYNAVSKLKIYQDAKIFETSEKELQNSKKILVSEAEETYINEMTEELENPDLKEILRKLGYLIASSNLEEKKK